MASTSQATTRAEISIPIGQQVGLLLRARAAFELATFTFKRTAMPPLGSSGDISSDDGFEGGPTAPIAPATQQQPVMMDTSLLPSLYSSLMSS
jgi:hypothetical protein